MRTPHTYLDGIGPFKYQGLWAMRASHSTATLSPGGICGLYGLRLMHRLNIFLSRSGPRAGRAPFLLVHCPNPNPSIDEYNYIFNNITKYLWTAFEDEQKKKRQGMVVRARAC